MDVFEAIHDRRSVRKYLDAPVEWDKISMVLEAARLAPSAGNIQDWHFVVITEPDLRKKLAESALSQHWIAKAPIIIVICSVTDRIKRFYGLRGERLYTIQDCAVAATHMMLMAHSLGLGTCWIGAFDEEVVSRVLSIPETSRPQVILTLGYADEKPQRPPRLPLEHMAFLNVYGSLGRIKDLSKLMWDYNVVGNAIKSGKQTLEDIDQQKIQPKKDEISRKIKAHMDKISEKFRTK